MLYSCVFQLKKACVRNSGKQFLCVATWFPRSSCLARFVCSHSSLSPKNLSKSGIAPLATRPENWLAAGCRSRATGFKRPSQSARWLTGPLFKRLAASPAGWLTGPHVWCLRSHRSPFRPPPSPPCGSGSWGFLGWPSGRLPNRPRQPPPEPARLKRLPARLLAVAPLGGRRNYPLRRPQQPPLERQNQQTPKTH